MPSLVRYEVLLPVQYNDGREVEAIKHRLAFDEVVERFGAGTLEPQHLFGRWVFSAEEYEDALVRLVVEVDDLPEHHDWFASWKETLKERFEQLDIRMTWHPIHVV
jgi:hypothetical protein